MLTPFLVGLAVLTVFVWLLGKMPVKQHSDEVNVMSPGYGPEYMDDETRTMKILPPKCWQRIQEIRAVSREYQISFAEGAVIVCGRYNQPIPATLMDAAALEGTRRAQQEMNETELNIRASNQWRENNDTKIVDGITERTGIPVDNWPVRLKKEE